MDVDKSDAADAKRMRWLLSGHSYFMEEEMLCGHAPTGQDEQDRARAEIDAAMSEPEPQNAVQAAAGGLTQLPIER